MSNKFSQKAYEDGYDFSMFPENEQELTKEYYTNKEEIREVANLVKAARYYIKYSDFDCSVKPLIDYDWRFFESGMYQAVIVRCSKSAKKDSEDYIIELMLDEHTIKYIKLNPYGNNPITSAIFEELDYEEKYSKIVGRYVILEINNTIYNNKAFSKVTELEFVEKSIINLHLKMWKVIRKTDFRNMISERIYKNL